MVTNMNETISAELARINVSISDLEQEFFALSERLRWFRQEKEAWLTIQTMRNQADQKHVESTTQVPVPKKVETHANAASGAEEYGKKSKVMKEHILTSGDDGVTPRSVQEYMANMKLPVSINFVYKTLNTLKADNDITSQGGVFRPVTRQG